MTSHLFVKKAIEIGLDRDKNDREMISKLLAHFAHDLEFTSADFNYAFDHFAREFENYGCDLPDLAETLACFICRAIYDECLNATYLVQAESFDADCEG